MVGRCRSVALEVVGVTRPVPSLFLITDTYELFCAWIPKVELTFTVTSIRSGSI
jgi:hypothetical protein